MPVPARADGILYWFVVTTIPAGGAPLVVRRAWVDVPLPVRCPPPVEGPQPYLGHDVTRREIVRLIEDGIAVEPLDAIKALRLFGRDDAAQWWEHFFSTRPSAWGLVFRRPEGRLLPLRLAAMLHPELDGFD